MDFGDKLAIVILLFFVALFLWFTFELTLYDKWAEFKRKWLERKYHVEELEEAWLKWLEDREVDYFSLDGKSFINYLSNRK